MTIRFAEETSAFFLGLESAAATYGVTWGDVDLDGLPDLYVNDHFDAPGRLFLSAGGEPREAVEADFSLDAHAAIWADYDGDGARELLELTGGGGLTGLEEDASYYSNLLWEFEDGRLAAQEDRLGLAHPMSSARSATPFDFDGDGDLDVFVGARERPDGAGPATVFLQGEDGRFASAPDALGADLSNVTGLFPGDFDGDGDADFVSAQHSPFVRYFIPWDNFTAYGVAASGTPPASSAVVADFDNDMDSDALVFGAGQEEQVAVLDDRRLRFDLRTPEAELEIDADAPLRLNLHGWSDAVFAIGSEGQWGNPDGIRLSPHNNNAKGRPEGLEDAERPTVGVWRDVEAGVWKLAFAGPDNAHFRGTVEAERPFRTPPAERLEIRREAAATLIEGDPDRRPEGTPFPTDLPVISAAGGDFDNDGDVDVFALVGRAAGNLSSVMFENDGEGGFTEIRGGPAAPGGDRGLVQTASVADADRDGWLDLMVASGRGPSGFSIDGGYDLFRNQGEGNGWLTFDLESAGGEADVLGSVIRLHAGGGAQMRVADAGQRLHGQDDPLVHFGLGEAAQADRVEIVWRDGRRDEIGDLPAGQHVNVWRGGWRDETREGGDASDVMIGAFGRDWLAGGRGRDHLDGGGGADVLRGEAGDDVLTGGWGWDWLWGGWGDDVLQGGPGADTLVGGPGADIFRFAPGNGPDRILDWEDGADLLDLSGVASGFGELTLSQDGPDAVIGWGTGLVRLADTDAAALGEEDAIL
ncbi:MAG: cartilage acidic protein [Pseudomonadota bacterium]